MYREINLGNYLPAITKDTKEFKQIVIGENPEFNLLTSEKGGYIEDAFNDQFVMDATEYGVKRWENILKIYPSIQDTLEQRKFKILVRLNRKIPYTYTVLKNQLEIYFGKENFSIDLKHKIYELNIAVKTFDYFKFEEVMKEIKLMLPCNLIFNQKILYVLEGKIFCGSTSLIGEKVTIYPWQDKKLKSKTKVYNTITNYISSEKMMIYPKEA